MRNFAHWFYGATAGSTCTGIYFYYFTPNSEKDNKKEIVKTSKWDSNWDKREVRSLIKPDKNRSAEDEQKKIAQLTPTATRHILLIRHGQYEETAATDADRHLTPLGREQASVLGQYLRDLKYNYTHIIRSNLTRATETAEIIQKYLPDIQIKNSELLNEGKPIPSEPKFGSFWYEYQHFVEGPRIEAAFRKYFHRASAEQKDNSYEIVVCHANVIRYFLCRLLQFPPEAWLRFTLHNCSITWVAIHPNGNADLRFCGNIGFMPVDKMSTY